MRIFADCHHQGLYASLHYLLEDRLGYELYKPIGVEWFEKGYWKIAELYGNPPETISQFLSLPTIAKQEKDGTYRIVEETNGYVQKAVTFEQFCGMEFDIIIASVPEHIEPYKKLIKDHMPEAKLVFQLGNVDWHLVANNLDVNNILASVKPFKSDKHILFYKQEFDTALFYPAENPPLSAIASFVNCLPEPEKYFALKKELNEYIFSAHGITCPDGIIQTTSEIARIMRSCKFGYHNKPTGDGFGHIIFNWMASGRPVLVNLKEYKDGLAGELLIDGETCINISDKNAKQIAGIVREISSLQYFDMCRNVKRVFKRKVNFEEEAQKVQKFLDALL